MPGSVLGSDTLLTGINGAFGVTKLASEASRAPVATDDANSGFAAGSLWQFGGQTWLCQSASAGAAVWSLNWPQDGALLGDVCAANGTVQAAYGPARLFAAAATCGVVTRASDSTTTTITYPAGSKVADFNAADAFIEGTTGGWSQLNDQSGNTLHATQATQANMPSFFRDALPNGQRALAINGYAATSIQQLLLPVGLATQTENVNVIMVCMPRSNCLQAAFWELGVTASNTQEALGTNSSGGTRIFHNLGTGASSNIKTAPTLVITTFTATAAQLYNDELTLGSSGGLTSHPNTGGFIGNVDYTAGAAGSFDLLALIVMSGTLTAANLTAIRAAAYAQFNIRPQLRNNIIMAGDSIGAGYNGVDTNSMPWMRAIQHMMEAAGTPVAIQNNSTPSQTLAGINAASAAYITNSIIAGKNNIVIVQGGSNDMAINSLTPAQTLTQLQTAIATARAAGASRVGAYTSTPRTNAGSFTEANRQIYNSLIRNSSGADFIVDVGADPIMGAAGANLNNALYSSVDNAHPTSPVGYSYLANDLYTALKPILV